jgi:putative ABC transport system permease protein
VAIVNARLAGSFWPGRSALGRQLRLLSSEGNITYRIVGVVPDIVYEELGEETPQSQLTVYVPYARAGWRTMAFLVRTTGNPASLAPTARRAVREADPAFAAFDLMTMADRRLFTSWGERFLGRTFGAFAVTGLLLACLGAYGLTAYSAAQRAREIGVRLAIGAQPRDIVRLLLGRGGRLALVGAVAGLPLAFAAARLLQGMLFRVSPWDPRVWAGVPVALVATMLLANFIPARRASQADPAASLRHE